MSAKVEPHTSQNATSIPKSPTDNPEAAQHFKNLTAAHKLHAPKEPSLSELTGK